MEDLGPDACLALLYWLARACAVPVEALRDGPGRAWVQVVREWETTGTAAAARTTWSALLAALGHGYLSPAGAPDGGQRALHPRLGVAWRAALRCRSS